MKKVLVFTMLLSILLTGCGRGKKAEVQMQNTEKVQETTQAAKEVTKNAPFEKVNVIDYSKIGDETLLIIGDDLSNCQKYDIDIEQTYIEAMMLAKPYIEIRVKYEQKPNQENKNADLYNTENVGTVTDNKEAIQFGIISDWEFYDGKDLGKMSLLEVADYIYNKFGLSTDCMNQSYNLTVKSFDIVKDEDGNTDYYKIIDKNGFIFYDYIDHYNYKVGKTYKVTVDSMHELETERNPLSNVFMLYHYQI